MVIVVVTVADGLFGLYGSAERADEPLFMPPPPPPPIFPVAIINFMVAVDHTADIKRHVYVYSRGAPPLSYPARSGR